MRQVNLSKAKVELAHLIDAALAGEVVVIARAGRPLVRMVPYRAADEPRRPGNEEIWMADDFDAPLDGVLGAAFRGERR
jgi:prevent-host-death family protein